MSTSIKCGWAYHSKLMEDYHDNEWGKPLKSDLELFSKLMLDCQQAGLSWAIILNKRKSFLEAYDGFNPYKVSKYDEKDIERLLNNPGIVRNRLKVLAMIHNSNMYLKHFSKEGSFTEFIWGYTNGKSVDQGLTDLKDMPTHSIVSDQMSQDLKRLGFKFVGTTVVYAFLQAVGVYNDHLETCPIKQKYKEESI